MPTNIGTYKGVEIRPGTDAEIQAQMREIDTPKAPNVGSDLISRANELGTQASKQTGVAFNPIPNPVPAPSQSSVGSPTPTLPTPTAPTIQETFTTSLTKVQENQRKQLESAYQKEIERIDREREESKRNIDEISTLQSEGVLKDMSQLSAPYRESLEKTERDRLYINENFEANQKLTNELDSLLTEGNELIRQQKQLPIATAYKNPRVNKTIEDVNARAGVIQAVMSARNGQISVAENMIDRTISAINADRQDQLNYYTTLLNFYEGQRKDAREDLITLDKEKQTFLKAQIGMLEGDLERSQKTADYVKELMLSPETASMAADAGITLADSIETMNEKISKQAVRKEIQEIIKDATNSGASSSVVLRMSKATTPEEANRIAAESGVFKKTTGGMTTSEINASNFDSVKLEAANLFEQDRAKNKDKKVSPDLYYEMRSRVPASYRDDFDRSFKHLLSSESRARFAIPIDDEEGA